VARRLLLGAEAEGVFTLFALVFFLMGVILFGIGLLGEYIGRIYQQVRARPRYVVQTILEELAPAARRQVGDAANAAAILSLEQCGVGR
jgi:undecaprenyl-phosphate 4-deoxy-4-formamido-L-arabinose transferase